MKNANLIRKRTAWFSLLAIFVAAAFLWADDGGLLGKQEVKTLIHAAKTAQDHERLAQHYDAMADQIEVKAKEHEELAALYKANPWMHAMKHESTGKTAGDCQDFADELHKSAQRCRQLAADHREMARLAPK